ncbi:hypothetical protein [Amycolatopsis sp. Hca4]|uniref:hypothetical protein n=1 Tax=Amycolatopsis sp. Hca4 TaxID=2742131 RepID=UPI001591F2B5|nr:hypothetical protein [Amycolatopsis sp. Hca4]QKV74140.1 hypothetical protein HUT10_10455 [Amycolatopsis sp. Hca4]
MSLATDFLQEWINKAAQREPSITRTTAQRWPQIGPPPHFKPGITSYGWGINGTLVKDSSGHAIGLKFSKIEVWFSDRGLNLDSPPPDSCQQFLGTNADREEMTFTISGDTVKLDVKLTNWSNEPFSRSTTVFDEFSNQLVFFNYPAAGPDPVTALLVVSFADTGAFGWV